MMTADRASRTRTASVGLVGVVAAALITSGCGAGADATTQRIISSGNGVTQYSDRIRILNALVFPPVPRVRPATVLSVGLANDWTEADRLSAIELVGPAGGAQPGWVEIHGPREIPAQGVLLIGAATSPTTAYLCGGAFPPGSPVTLTYRFAYAAPVTTVTTIVAPVGGYSEAGGLAVAPPELPAVTPCATPPIGSTTSVAQKG